VGLNDARLVVDVTPNRPDLLSHVGVAREVAAAEGLHFGLVDVPGEAADAALPELVAAGGATAAVGTVTIRIEDEQLCPRYIGIVIRGVKVGPSPAWMASRLRAVGLRPISNVVDATNWVLHEMGQPLHAFDLKRLGDSVVVRRARDGERITTLDGVERTLTGEMLVIADDRRPVAVAGVMGGAATEVQDDTTDILLECALFHPGTVRRGRRALNLSTDASYRFERGIDAGAMAAAAFRAARLIAATAGGHVDAAGAAGAGPAHLPPVRLRLGRVRQLLGESFDATTVAGYLRPLGFDVAADDGDLTVGVPPHRHHDVSREEDLIEEVARRHGYDRFSDELRPFRPGTVPTHPLFLVEDRVRRMMIARGFLEAHTAAFAPAADGDVPLMLPLAATESRLRRSLVPGLLRRLEYNFGRGARSIRLFELGTVFAMGDEAGGLPREETRLAVAFTGLRRPPHWAERSQPFDVWDLKGLAGDLAAAFGLGVVAGSDVTQLEQGVSFTLVGPDGEARGAAGRVRDAAIDAPAWATECWMLELRLEADEPRGVRYQPLPTQPAVTRDLALVVPAGTEAGGVAAAIRENAGPLLEAVDTFDVYSGVGIPEGTRSIAYSLRFRAGDRTLTDAEVDDVVRRLLQRLSDDLGVRQRA
jgi:phenylalanyl-tRNA synthetase beta chain